MLSLQPLNVIFLMRTSGAEISKMSLMHFGWLRPPLLVVPSNSKTGYSRPCML